MLATAHRRRLAAVVPSLLLCVALVAGCTTAGLQAEGAQPPPGPGAPGPAGDAPRGEPGTLVTGEPRASRGVVAAGGADAVYNYGPTVMADGGRIRMWWCSQYGSARPPGDDILYATAAAPDGPFTGVGGGAPTAVLSGEPGRFDGVHTCDPSVIRVDGTYYMYYTGARGDHAVGNAIGLVTSTDGVHWSRVTDGPIVTPARDTHRANDYGAGQPAAVYLDGWFYLMFTDTTGRAAGWNGAGQFLLRSKDPAFGAGVQALGPEGFVPVPGTASPRAHSLVDAFSADLMWVDALDAFAIAHQTADGTSVTFWNRDFSATPYHPVVIPSEWEEGPGLVRRPEGHAPVDPREPCGRVPLDVFHATVIGEAEAPTGLRHFGVDLTGVDGCATPDRAVAVLDGFAVPSPVRTMDVVVDGRLLRVDRRSVALELADHVLAERLAVLDRVPVAARLAPGARAVRAPGEGTGFVLDGTLWPVTSAAAVGRNESTPEPVSGQEWRNYPAGPTLGPRS
ncbi:glycosyl hydrolase family 43 [Prauserella shujinwangii]|uniref:Glycosyl hydrolase family 43 n=1 Tax=Prauserella shujinwangii TaxID=1453103 RepID=A0A2T0LRF7_9PSEU|nr:family 43 glycosylhydrolase [Prauserella shujinwangii]PRX46086.1 glycosyl hydrolase family 43 [Prauserella shujinwangii]